MAKKLIQGDFDVQGKIMHNGVEISYSGGGGGGGSDFVITDIDASVQSGLLHLIFPPGIIPLCYYFSGNDRKYYFDYPEEQVLDANGTVIENSVVASDDRASGIEVHIPDTLEDEILETDCCLYIRSTVDSAHWVDIMQWPMGNTYKILFPSGGGSIPIDDLTNIQPVVPGPDELYVNNFYTEDGYNKVEVRFTKQWVPTRLLLTDMGTGNNFEVTFNYDADNNTFEVATTSGFDTYGYVITGGTNYDSDFIFCIESSISNINNLTIEGNFEYREGGFDYEY